MNENKTPFWRDSRFVKLFIQAIILLSVVLLLTIFGQNLGHNFQQLGLQFGFDFIFDPDLNSRFDIGDSPIPYQATDPYYRAILVGLLNSLRVIIIGLILAFVLGVIIGLGRLSDNWLVRQLATIYVETIRNTPLLLQLFFWYTAVLLKLPKIDNPVIVMNQFFLSNQGIYLPSLAVNEQNLLVVIFVLVSLILMTILWRQKNQVIIQQGKTGNVYQILFMIVAIAAIMVIIFGLDWQLPQYDGQAQRIQGGLSLSPEFAALLVGLSIYTAAFIAEVVRAGIQSVPKGQWEAAKALGLSSGLMMRLVIFPQALRVMIPPLTSEFLNLAKNSSLASAVAYRDIYAVSSTISNQTGNAVEMLLIVMATYLIIDLIISGAMNGLNYWVQIKEK